MQTGYCAEGEPTRETTTNEPAMCGGFAGFECHGEGETCIDDPRDDCNPFLYDNDCAGICVVKPEDGPVCDTRGHPPCEDGESCVHDLDAHCGGTTDCPGVCMVIPEGTNTRR